MSYLTDEEVVGAVVAALARDGRVNPADIIHVAAENGLVRLTGMVQSAWQKEAAGEVARPASDGRRVENDLTVATEGEVSDSELRQAVLTSLAQQPELAHNVGCSVESGVVILVGSVRDAAQDQQAMRIAEAIKGVERVVSDLKIVGSAPVGAATRTDDVTLASAVALAITNAGVDVIHRTIRVDHGIATLEGKVTSEREKQLAGEVAASVDGIRTVHNQLTLPSVRSRDKGTHPRIRRG